MRPVRDNTEAEIEAFERVCEQLGGFDARISPEWADGYLSALAAGPRILAIDEWLPALAGEAFERAFADPEDRARAEAALAVRMAILQNQLDAESLDEAPDQLRLASLMVGWDEASRAEMVAAGRIDAEHANELVSGADWADGFFAAIEDNKYLYDVDLESVDEATEHFVRLLTQINVLRLPEGSERLAAHISQTYKGETVDRDRLIDDAGLAAQDLRLWWVDHAPKPETRRVERAPGRNEPCPCGSGKKFKKCHGGAQG